MLNGTHRLTEGTAVSAVDTTVVAITAALSGTPLTGVTFHLIAATGLHLNAEGPMVVHQITGHILVLVTRTLVVVSICSA